MTHHLKTKPEYFQAVIDGRKPFEVRNNDRDFKVGDRVILEEYEGAKFYEECPKYRSSCSAWDEIDNDEELYSYGQDEAIDMCGKKRLRCTSYIQHKYTGRRCLVTIKEIFYLNQAELEGFVAFTFEIKNVQEHKSSVEVEECD